ncbi:uncharacterized protein HaLaN_10569, partial [Haematococcus lacustris]
MLALSCSCGLPERDVLSFYSSPKARALYKQHITSVTSRVNSLTGVAYKDDPTIMGWDVMNEPRCPGDVLSFYSSPKARALYKQHITSVTSRVNSLTGVAYKDDPTIMGWDVMNEPRCPGCDSPTNKAFHTSWLQEMSDHVAAAAPKQLIMLGSEGFFGPNDPQLYYNP